MLVFPFGPQLTRCQWTLSRDGHVILLISDVKFRWRRADGQTAGQGGQNQEFYGKMEEKGPELDIVSQ